MDHLILILGDYRLNAFQQLSSYACLSTYLLTEMGWKSHYSLLPSNSDNRWPKLNREINLQISLLRDAKRKGSNEGQEENYTASKNLIDTPPRDPRCLRMWSRKSLSQHVFWAVLLFSYSTEFPEQTKHARTRLCSPPCLAIFYVSLVKFSVGAGAAASCTLCWMWRGLVRISKMLYFAIQSQLCAITCSSSLGF